MTAPGFTAHGKEVLALGAHYADAADTKAAEFIAEACNAKAKGWQPIETAPHMRGILLWADTSTEGFPNWKMGSGFYHTGMNCWIWEGEQVREWAFPPTHWMPLPSAPVTA